MQFKIDNARPVYLQIEEHIRNAVITNIYSPGSRIPAVRELAAELKVNPNTVQRAMAEFEQQGLLIANGTLGKLVTNDQTVIDSTKDMAIQAVSRECVSQFKSLGISAKEAARLLLQLEEE